MGDGVAYALPDKSKGPQEEGNDGGQYMDLRPYESTFNGSHYARLVSNYQNPKDIPIVTSFEQFEKL